MTDWIDPESLMVSEISQTEKDSDFTHMWNPEKQRNKQKNNKLIDTQNR